MIAVEQDDRGSKFFAIRLEATNIPCVTTSQAGKSWFFRQIPKEEYEQKQHDRNQVFFRRRNYSNLTA